MSLFAVWFIFCIIVCLWWFWVCVLYSFYDVRKTEKKEWSWSFVSSSSHSSTRNTQGRQASHPDACCYYLSLSIMHVFNFEVLQKDLIQTKNYFCCGYTTIVIILAITLPIVILGVTKPIATIWYIYHPRIKTRESLSGHPKNVFLQNKGFKEKLGGKAEPCPREVCEGDHFWKKCLFQKWHIT